MNKEEIILKEQRDSLLRQALELSSNPQATKADLKKADILMAQAAQLRSRDVMQVRAAAALEDATGQKVRIETAEQRERRAEREEFRQYLRNAEETRSYSPITSPNSFVPAAFFRELLTGIAQYSPILSADNIRLIEQDNGRPMTVPALDLTQVTASIVGQAVDNPPTTNPVAGKISLGQFTYRTNPVAASFELEQDSFESISEILMQAYTLGFARGIGADLINGNGSTSPLGLLTAATDSTIVTASNTAITSDEIAEIYFSVNRAYRASPKAAWVMNDATYEIIRKAKDTTNGRPLLNMVDDREVLMGKKILIAPDMPTGAGSKAIVFGDLSQYVCRVNRSGARVTRSTEAPGYVEQGIALYTAWMSLDARLNTVGSTAPVVYATLAS